MSRRDDVRSERTSETFLTKRKASPRPLFHLYMLGLRHGFSAKKPDERLLGHSSEDYADAYLTGHEDGKALMAKARSRAGSRYGYRGEERMERDIKKGDRVGAILGVSASDKVVELLGFGVYMGREVPPSSGGWMAEALAEEGMRNPKIELDSGETVWGCQCWWAPEEKVKKRLESWKEAGWEIREKSMAEALSEEGSR